MKNNFRFEDDSLIWERDYETIKIQPWGKDSLRVRSTKNPQIQDLPWALLDPQPGTPECEISEMDAILHNGKIEAIITADGRLSFARTGSGGVLLEEAPSYFPKPPARQYKPVTGNLYHIDVRFNPQPDEHFYGLGQHQNGLLDQKGCVVELSQRNTEVSIPFLLSSRGYGFLWNNPAVGRVELGMNGTHWVAEESRQIDYWITAGDSPA